MDWLNFALGVMALLVVGWLFALRGRQLSWPGAVAGLGCLIVAGLNSAAPVRGALDPDYAGYTFGLLHSGKGLGVTALAGAVWLASVASAFIAVTCAALLVIIGWPTVSSAVVDPRANSIELGEYLTIPGLLGTALLLGLVVVPFVIGLVWATRQARR